MNETKRVIATMFKSYNRSADEYTETLIQYLQQRKTISLFGVKLFNYWKTVDEETVPSFAWIQNNTLGYTDWKSKWVGIENILWSKLK